VIQAGDKQIGYLRFWNLMSMGVNGALASAMREDFVDCDAIVLDLRGRGGIVPAVLALNRTVSKLDKPVVVTIDGLTRSAKEMLTYLLKKQEHVLVVGERTTGAVTGATVLKLPSGNSIMIPVASAESLKQFIDGEILEGVGVGPDEPVKHFLPFCAGQDRILDHAVKRAVELAIEKKDIAKDLNGESK
jgi:C-terminal processing protease CtpA/Prc